MPPVQICAIATLERVLILQGGFKRGRFPDLDLLLTNKSFFTYDCSFVGTYPIFPGFSRFAWGWFGEFPDLVLLLLLGLEPGKSIYVWNFFTYGFAAQSGPFRKKVGNRPVWKPPSLAYGQNSKRKPASEFKNTTPHSPNCLSLVQLSINVLPVPSTNSSMISSTNIHVLCCKELPAIRVTLKKARRNSANPLASSVNPGFAPLALQESMWVGSLKTASQRCRNDDKNNFCEVESKGGSFSGGSKTRVNRGPTLKFYCRPESTGKTAFWKVAFLLSSLFPRKDSDNNFGQLPPFHPAGGRTRGP